MKKLAQEGTHHPCSRHSDLFKQYLYGTLKLASMREFLTLGHENIYVQDFRRPILGGNVLYICYGKLLICL